VLSRFKASLIFVKMFTFTVHLCLPKAHVEAIVSSSLIVACVLLKLCGCGLVFGGFCLFVHRTVIY
jgi:NADH:ubiquinone oxidoreductase subunit 4 (subunit M)